MGHDGVLFTKNDGQWDGQVRYRAKMTFGNIYLENNGITYHFYDKSRFNRVTHADTSHGPIEEIDVHTVKVDFVGSNAQPLLEGSNAMPWYENYFVGDESKWASQVKSYKEVLYNDLYDGIDLRFYQYGKYVKYDYIIKPGNDPSQIHLAYRGYDAIEIVDGNLIITTSLGTIKEMAPVAYQKVNGQIVEVACEYKLVNGNVTFDITGNYDQSLELVIDPILVFSSYTGSTADNWGYTATYDESEHVYGGGIVFGTGYPTTVGAYQTVFSGGGLGVSIDIGISKFSPDGVSLIYSTYLGGTGAESPHSLVVDSLDNLFVLASTSSTDYPITVGAFDNSFNGGTTINIANFSYGGGSDLAITKFNAAGTALIGSTYIGGSGNDGLNDSTPLQYFYGDEFRGEIIVDANGNPIVTSTTPSTNFPVTAGAAQLAHGGAYDAVLFTMNANLTALLSSSFWGGSGFETGYGIQLDQNGNIFLSGATTSANMTTTPGVLKPTFGGVVDGYIARFNPGITTILSSTYIGTTGTDMTYFVQIDANGDVYTIGVSEGNYPVSAGYYTNSGSHQFIQKMNNTLTSGIWSTVIGSGGTAIDISPTAFLVNDCGLIYLAGWGGGLAHTNSSTTGLPVTTNAFQNTTDGNDFYFMVLEPDAQALLYATFFGGTALTGEHVDGGTCRFDKNGVIYHAVCSGCGGNSLFPSTPGVWSTTNNSSNCNLAVFKFGLNNIETLISLPSPYVCIPSLYTFGNNTVGANYYIWDFGDGDTSYAFEPVHEYQDTGTYLVTLIAIDTNGCVDPDTASILIDVYAINDAEIDTVPILCPGDTVQLNASGGLTYQWYPNTNIINSNTPNPLVFPDVTTTYNAVITDSCSTDTISIVVTVHSNTVTTSPDTAVCLGQSVQIQASGGVSYAWHPDPTLSATGIQNPIATPTNSTMYYVDVTTVDGCIITDSVYVFVFFNPPIPVISNDTTICQGDSIVLFASNAPTINWISTYNIAPITGGAALVWPDNQFTYVAEFTNSCATVLDSVTVSVDQVFPVIGPDTSICIGDTAKLYAGGGVGYQWIPAAAVTDPDSNVTYASPDVTSVFEVIVTNINGCQNSTDMTVQVLPLPDVNAGPDHKINYGDVVQLDGSTLSGIAYFWTPSDSLSCINCLTPFANPVGMTQYVLHVIDANGCRNTDTTIVFVDGDLYLPNAFTPNGDGRNDLFMALGSEINTFELTVFDRWGQVVFQTTDIEKGWDGTVDGKQAKTDVYVWVVKFSYLISPQVTDKKIGHVTLLR